MKAINSFERFMALAFFASIFLELARTLPDPDRVSLHLFNAHFHQSRPLQPPPLRDAHVHPLQQVIRPALSGGMDWWRMEWPFSRVRKCFSEDEISRKISETPQTERFLPNFRLRNLKIQSPKKCNSIFPAIPLPH